MGSQGVDDEAAARERIAALVRSPAESRRLLPGVVGLLEAEDDHLRLSAACGICLAGRADPELLPYLIRRLLNRLHADSVRAEAMFAFEYLASQFPEEVDEIVDELREENDGREPLSYARPGGFRRSHIYSPSSNRHDVGRTRLAGDRRDPGPQQVYNDDGEPVKRQPGPKTAAEEGAHETDDDESDPDTSADEESSTDATDDDTATPEAPDGQSGGVHASPDERPDWILDEETLEAILAESAFEDITILAGHEQGLFSENYRTLAVARGTERATALRLFRQPESNTDGFERYLSVALDRWNRVSAASNVISLYDYGQRPQPWAAVAYTEQTLADRDRLPIGEALWNAITLTRTVETLHDNNVIHGGLDPGSIAYTGAIMDENERLTPLIDHVGLIEAFRFHFDPSEYLDPRYAAPEYFDATFGEIDHATDIYQLGAILYRLFTGEAPYDGDDRPVQRQILEGSAVAPSEQVETVPRSVDNVISKAMAAQKLTRYETVAHLEQDLLQLRDHLVTDG
ncbi:protein kinase family protein [Halapricum salinum]|uniref:Protein kinase domain-containing protein n=1 Tax=Halapricum salinum TaxID=1457250 RepID=A0A4D6H8A9_9EURY|nr:hypothetical protein [Halapricum salinum]QCC50264.1 hypothetical protein DV733_03005 [Halapricum salinum]